MQILGLFYPLLSVCSILGFQKRFLHSLLGGLVLMDFITFLNHLTPDYDLGCGFFVFGNFKELSEILGLFWLFAFGLKSLYFPCFSRGLVQFLCDLRLKSGELKIGIYSKKVLDENFGLLEDAPLNDIVEESTEKSDSFPGSDRKINREFDEEYDFDNNYDHIKDYTGNDGEFDPEYRVDDGEVHIDEDGESDVSALRKLVKIERGRANAARAELAKERAASATAAEEAMAMILRLQNEKSSIEMEFNQYRRLAEEKQIHHQEVIQSLEWLVWGDDSEMSLLQEELMLCRRKPNRLLKSDGMEDLEEEVEEDPSSLSGYTNDILDNVVYSSLDLSLSPK